MAEGENINARILVWARESAGLALEDVSDRAGLSSLGELEAGIRLPTRNQLEKLSALYRRPLITFYMDDPPPKGDRGEDYRTRPGSVSARENALLDALLRDLRARQAMVRSLLEEEDEAVPLPFVRSVSLKDGVEPVAKKLSETLRIKELRIGHGVSVDDLFRDLRARVEALGVFVLLVGDLGSHHSAIGENVFRGFVISDDVAPFIVINDQDARSARSFTLVHELCHIFLGQSGISGRPEVVSSGTVHGRTEQFCNDVASEVLLPGHALTAALPRERSSDKTETMRLIEALAQTWSVSEPLVAYRLYRRNWIDGSRYTGLNAAYEARWNATKLKEKAKTQQNEGGPSYYIVRQHRLGNALLDVVRRTLRDNILTHTKAAKVLGVKSSSVEPLLRRVEAGNGALVPQVRR